MSIAIHCKHSTIAVIRSKDGPLKGEHADWIEVMSFKLENFKITNLYGYRTVDINFTENRLILVGENGTGKTTALNLLFYVLTQQWNRIDQYQFDSLELNVASLDGEPTSPITMHKQDMNVLSKYPHLKAYFPGERFSDKNSKYFSTLRRFLEMSIDESNDDFAQRLKSIEQRVNQLKDAINADIWYWPTYRRIEQDLENVFRNLEGDEDENILQRLQSAGDSQDNYLELVEFGMKDVNDRISVELSRLARSNHINDLPGTFLRDVIRRTYAQVNAKDLFELDDLDIDKMLLRVREELLKYSEKQTLKETIQRLKGLENVSDIDKVTLQLLVRLLELHKQQDINERSFVEFSAVCNKYLRGKELVFDNTRFDYEIRLKDSESTRNIDMNVLSAGEMQIVSLFSHVYLSKRESFFLLVDEPELSLSVPWQRTFLSDIVNSGKCIGLMAVTHSPFIYENELKQYARAITEFWS